MSCSQVSSAKQQTLALDGNGVFTASHGGFDRGSEPIVI
jgi:hypothetical protein